jgi:flavin-binding protein dodecin
MTGVTKTIRVSGESESSIEEAISAAVGRAALTIEEIVAYEVVSIDGSVDEAGVPTYRVTVDITFTVKEHIHG